MSKGGLAWDFTKKTELEDTWSVFGRERNHQRARKQKDQHGDHGIELDLHPQQQTRSSMQVWPKEGHSGVSRDTSQASMESQSSFSNGVITRDISGTDISEGISRGGSLHDSRRSSQISNGGVSRESSHTAMAVQSRRQSHMGMQEILDELKPRGSRRLSMVSSINNHGHDEDQEPREGEGIDEPGSQRSSMSSKRHPQVPLLDLTSSRQ